MGQCTAKAKRTGERCKGKAVRGTHVCRVHGGNLPQVRKAATRRLAITEAQRMVQKTGEDLDPVAHLLDSLHRAATLVEVWGLMLAGLDDQAQTEALETGILRGELGYQRKKEGSGLSVRAKDRLLALDRQGMAQVHPFVVQYEQAIERRAKLAKLAIEAGVDERRVRLEEERGRIVADVFRAVFNDPELGLEPDRRSQAMSVAGRHLRLLAETSS